MNGLGLSKDSRVHELGSAASRNLSLFSLSGIGSQPASFLDEPQRAHL